MDWRDRGMSVLGPGVMTGTTFRDWLAILAENGFRVDPRRLPKAVATTLLTIANSGFQRMEAAKYGARIERQEVPPPVFVIGHYRSGTTHLHNLLSLDRRFAYPKFKDVVIPHTFLTGGWAMGAISAAIVPRTRMGIDNVALGPDVPCEEENALCALTGLSPYTGWAFPERAAHYDRYSTFRGVPQAEVERWQAAYVWLAKKLTLAYEGRPIVYKSPPNTGRVRLLLEMFPDARFVHIHRKPASVYRSTKHLLAKTAAPFAFHKLDPETLHRRVVDGYREMYDAYFEDRDLIPAGRFCDVRYADLTADPVGEVERIYGDLSLPDFETARPGLETYLKSLSGYRKNEFDDLPTAVRDELSVAWSRAFEEFGYADRGVVRPPAGRAFRRAAMGARTDGDRVAACEGPRLASG